jgi:hypothetical protein
MNPSDLKMMVRVEHAWWVRPLLVFGMVTCRFARRFHIPGRTRLADAVIRVALHGVRAIPEVAR